MLIHEVGEASNGALERILVELVHLISPHRQHLLEQGGFPLTEEECIWQIAFGELRSRGAITVGADFFDFDYHIDKVTYNWLIHEAQ